MNNLKKLAQFEGETAVLKGWQVKHVQKLRVACISLFAAHSQGKLLHLLNPHRHDRDLRQEQHIQCEV